MEVEDWASNRDQTHIGWVLMLTSIERSINEVVCLNVDHYELIVRITEDVAEIIDFDAQYELDDALSELS